MAREPLVYKLIISAKLDMIPKTSLVVYVHYIYIFK